MKNSHKNDVRRGWSSLRLGGGLVLGFVACGESAQDLSTSAGDSTAAETTAQPAAAATAATVESMTPEPSVGNGSSTSDLNLIAAEPAEPELTQAEMAAALTDQTACAGVVLAPESLEVEVPSEEIITTEQQSPVALYLVLDNSGSMRQPADNSGNADTKWEQAVVALSQFAQDPESAGIDVALQYFNQNNLNNRRGGRGGGNRAAADSPLCDGSIHQTPQVAMGPLPGNTQAVVNSLNAAAPNGFTPTVGALTGGVAYCKQFQAENPDKPCVVVLVTDGQPNGCGLDSRLGCPDGMNLGLGMGGNCVDPSSASVLTPVAASGAAEGVQTFTVGMAGVTPEGFGLLNAIALAGGTDCSPDAAGAEACDVSASGAQGLLDALNAIRDSVTVTEIITETKTVVTKETLSCQWGIPEVPQDKKFSPALVNVTLALEGGTPENLGAVASEADCASVVSGWYFDNAAAPTTIHACPQSCSLIEQATSPAVEILLGCASVPPRAR